MLVVVVPDDYARTVIELHATQAALREHREALATVLRMFLELGRAYSTADQQEALRWARALVEGK